MSESGHTSGAPETAPVEPVAANTDPISAVRRPHAALRYTTLRLAIFVLALVVLWLVRVRGVLLVVLALLVSGLASYGLLNRQRDAMSVQITEAVARRRVKAAARAAREDSGDDDPVDGGI